MQEVIESEWDTLLSRRQFFVVGIGATACALWPVSSEAVLLRILWRLALRVAIRSAAGSNSKGSQSTRTVFRANESPAASRIYRPDPELIAPGFRSLYSIREIVHAHPSVIAVSRGALDRIQRHGVIALWVEDMMNFSLLEDLQSNF